MFSMAGPLFNRHSTGNKILEARAGEVKPILNMLSSIQSIPRLPVRNKPAATPGLKICLEM